MPALRRALVLIDATQGTSQGGDHWLQDGDAGRPPCRHPGRARKRMNLSDEQLRILRHMLGIDKPDEAAPEPYRDYYCACRGDANLEALASLGAVRLYRRSDRYDWYCTTGAGRAAAIASHRKIRHRKPKRMYARYLDIADAHTGLSFREFLTSPEYAEARGAA